MADRQQLRLVTWNIENGGEGRLDPIHAVLERSRADVIALQEVTSFPNLVDLARRLGMDHVLGEARNGFHVAWLSRYPIKQCINHRLPTLARTLLQIDIDWSGEPMSLFATHLASRHDPQSPLDEVGSIVTLMESAAGKDHFLAGDFNSLTVGDPVGTPPDGVEPRGEAVPGLPRHAIETLLRTGYADCFRQLHPTLPGYTYSSVTPWLRIDYAFASPHLASRLNHCQVIESVDTQRASDHLPLQVAFARAD